MLEDVKTWSVIPNHKQYSLVNATIFKKASYTKPVTARFVVETGSSIKVYSKYTVLEKYLIFLKCNIAEFVVCCFAIVGNKSPVRENSYLQLHPGQSH